MGKNKNSILKSVLCFLMVFFLFSSVLVAIFEMILSPSQNNYGGGSILTNEYAIKWHDVMLEYATKYGLEEYINVLLSILVQESGGDQDIINIMQVNDAVTTQEESIDYGCKHFKNRVDAAEKLGITDINAIVQSYNFGVGYLSYIKKNNNGVHTKELAKLFSDEMKKVYNSSIYGVVGYAESVMSRVGAYVGDAAEYFDELMKVATQYIGYPYVFGGISPDTSFDCSGFTQYVYKQVGVTLPRLAVQQYDACSITFDQSMAEPGDLVFFENTYQSANGYSRDGKLITHVGIYIGNGQMLHCGSSHGVSYGDLSSSYNKAHIVGYGKIIQ